MYLYIGNIDWYYPQVVLEKYENVIREKNMSNFITNDVKIYFDDSDEKIPIKKNKYINFFRRNFLSLGIYKFLP